MSAWLIVSVLLYALGCIVTSAAMALALEHPVIVRLVILAWPIVTAGVVVGSAVAGSVRWLIDRVERAR